MTRIVVMGAAGRMGARLLALAQDPKLGIRVTAAVERPDYPGLGRDAGEAAGIGNLGLPLTADVGSALKSADLVIDFSHPDATLAALEHAVSEKKAAVIGTTGLSDAQLGRLKSASRTIPIVFSPNMSVGVNVVFKILADVAKVTGSDYDVEIVEVHHRHKKDAPSGTAKRMAEVLAETLKRDLNQVGVYSRHGMIGERKPDEIGIQSIRAGDVVGEHTVVFAGLGERIEVTHRAHNRDNFARGALIAAAWVAGRKPGLYSMQNVLGLE